MDISGVVTQLGNVSALQQVLEAPKGSWTTPVDSGGELVTQLSGTFSTEVYAVQQGHEPSYPTCVYALRSAQPLVVDGYQVAQTDIYELEVRAETYDEIVTLTDSINTQLSAASIAMTITNAADGYESDPAGTGKYVRFFEVEIAYAASSTQTLPAALVYPIDRTSNESAFDNHIKQQVFNEYGIVLMAESSISTLLDDVMEQLLGFQQEAGWNDMEYVEGRALDGVAGLEVWREIYTDSNYIEEV